MGRADITKRRRRNFSSCFNVDIQVFVDIELSSQTNRTVNQCIYFILIAISFGKCQTGTCKNRNGEQTIRVVTANSIGQVKHTVCTHSEVMFILALNISIGRLSIVRIQSSPCTGYLTTDTPNRIEQFTNWHIDQRSYGFTKAIIKVVRVYTTLSANTYTHKDIVLEAFAVERLFSLSSSCSSTGQQ